MAKLYCNFSICFEKIQELEKRLAQKLASKILIKKLKTKFWVLAKIWIFDHDLNILQNFTQKFDIPNIIFVYIQRNLDFIEILEDKNIHGLKFYRTKSIPDTD